MAPKRPFQHVLGRTPQIKILDYLVARKEPASVVEIRKHIKVHYIYATKLVNALEAAGLLKGRRIGREHRVWVDPTHPLTRAVTKPKGKR